MSNIFVHTQPPSHSSSEHAVISSSLLPSNGICNIEMNNYHHPEITITCVTNSKLMLLRDLFYIGIDFACFDTYYQRSRDYRALLSLNEFRALSVYYYLGYGPVMNCKLSYRN